MDNQNLHHAGLCPLWSAVSMLIGGCDKNTLLAKHKHNHQAFK